MIVTTGHGGIPFFRISHPSETIVTQSADAALDYAAISWMVRPTGKSGQARESAMETPDRSLNDCSRTIKILHNDFEGLEQIVAEVLVFLWHIHRFRNRFWTKAKPPSSGEVSRHHPLRMSHHAEALEFLRCLL